MLVISSKYKEYEEYIKEDAIYRAKIINTLPECKEEYDEFVANTIATAMTCLIDLIKTGKATNFLEIKE